MAQDTREKLSGLTVFLHWLVGLTIIALMGVGFYMSEFEVYKLYPIHKSVGIIIFLFIVVRVLWRMKNGFPTPLKPDQPAIEKVLAKITHWGLILGMILFPVTGMGMSYFGGRGLQVFGFDLAAGNYVDGKPVALNGELAGLAHQVHGILLYAMFILIVLHVAGALKHHLVYKDGTLRRMWGKRVDS